MATLLRPDVPTALLSVVDKLVAKASPKLKEALLAAIERASEDFAAITANLSAAEAVGADELWAELVTGLSALYGPDGPLASGMLQAGASTASEISASWSKIETEFSSRATLWLDEVGAKRVTNISEETRAAVQRIVSDAASGPLSLRDAARQLVELPALGLDQRQMGAFERDVQRLTATADAESWTSQQFQLALDQTYKGKLYYRARRIAITEASDAGNAAVDFAIREAAAKGEIDGDGLELEWVTRAINACPICEALDGVRRAISGGFFVSRPVKSGPYKGQQVSVERPTVHPHCYCGIRTVDKARKSLRRYFIPDFFRRRLAA